MKKVIVYCGESIEDKCGPQLHPVKEVERANAMITGGGIISDNPVAYSNNTDFISAVKYIGKKQGVETEFFLNGVSHGDDIEPIFEDLNRSLDMINELGDTGE